MAMLLIYRIIVFSVSVVSNFAASLGLLWFAQKFVPENQIHDFDYNLLELGVIAGGLQLLGYLLMVSPLGRLFQSNYYPVRKLSMREESILMPLFDEVIEGYKANKKGCIKSVKLFMMDDTDVNASAFGKNKIALTTGLLHEHRWNRQVIKGVIAHELGHLHHRDLWFWHYVGAAGGILLVLLGILNIAQKIAATISETFTPFLFISLPLSVFTIFTAYFYSVVNLPAHLLGMLDVFFSRSQEYRADKFAADIMGCRGIISLLENFTWDEKHMQFGFLNMQKRSHPPSELRIEQILKHPDYVSNVVQIESKEILPKWKEKPRAKKRITKYKRRKLSSYSRINSIEEDYKNNSLNDLNYLIR